MLPVFASVVVALLALAVILGGRDEDQALSALPLTTCADALASTSPIKVCGVARTRAPFKARLTDRPCIYSRVIVDPHLARYRLGTSRQSARWAEFTVEDSTGKLLVIVDGADVMASSITRTLVDRLLPETSMLAPGLLDGTTGARADVMEETIHPGARVTITGTVRSTEEGRALFCTERCFVTDLPDQEFKRRNFAVTVIAAAIIAASLAFGTWAIIDFFSRTPPRIESPLQRIRAPG